ncbi:hypothetical protein BKA83DRAFT_4126712 [Pisolithus microcarpus]|nr:hypothetical protein BKA83DRAFT_4126712 [Pisolithus microcarpus]
MPKYHSAHPIHPNNIKLPTTPINEFYVVVIGQELGIFYSWNNAAARVPSGISKTDSLCPDLCRATYLIYKDYISMLMGTASQGAHPPPSATPPLVDHQREGQ